MAASTNVIFCLAIPPLVADSVMHEGRPASSSGAVAMEATIDQNRVIELTAKVAALEAIYQNYLSWAALTVAILTIVIALAAIISFAYFRHMAAGIAERAATEIAEAVANDYIQKMWPSFVADYHAYEDAMADDDIADRISEAQPDDGSH